MTNISVFLKPRFYKFCSRLHSRTFLSLPWTKKEPEECDYKACKKPVFFEMQQKESPSEKKKKCEKMEREKLIRPPNVDHLPGTKYKTCGSAILIQEESSWSQHARADDKELRRLEKMEAHPSLKGQLPDPLPPFTSVEQRLVDLSDNKVHPLYMKMQSIPKRKITFCDTTKAFTISSSIAKPKQLEINTELLDKKNILVDLKRSEPPKETIQYGMEKKLIHLEELNQVTKHGVPCEMKPEKHGASTKKKTTERAAVEQDRHILRRRLTNKESELDAKIVELQNDITSLTDQVAGKDNLLKQCEREKGNLVGELNAQNARLTIQLKEAANVENRLQQQVQQLKDQCSLSKSNLYDHMNSVGGLRDELDLLSEKNRELERRLHMASAERDSLGGALEEASDRILLLERHAREQEMRYQQSLKEYSLPQETMSLEDRMNGSPEENRSLLAEMDISEPTLSQECMSVYRQLRSLVQQLKSHQDDDSGLHSDCSTTSLDDGGQFSTGLLSEVAQELVNLVLDTDAVRLIERLEEAHREIHERDLELSKRTEKIMELNSRYSVCEVELQAAREDVARARNDVSSSTTAQDEVVSKARRDRDVAIERKTKLEIELAKTRMDLMQANGQLMESIQQKVELSQQLEQWQMDVHELLDVQVKSKLTSQEVRMRATIQTAPVPPPPRRRLLSFLYR